MKPFVNLCLAVVLLTIPATQAWSQPSSRWELTQQEAATILQQHPTDIEKLQTHIETALNEHHFDAVVHWAGSILKQNPDYRPAHIAIVKAELALGNFPACRAHLDQVSKLGPQDPESLGLDGMVCLLEHKAPQAVGLLERSLEGARKAQLSPSFCATTANSLVASLHQSGQPSKALQQCSQFLKEYPDCPELYVSASRLFRDAKNYNSALEVAQLGLSKFPEMPNLYASTALAEAALGHQEKCEKALNRLLRLDPKMGLDVKAILDGRRQDKAELQVDIK